MMTNTLRLCFEVEVSISDGLSTWQLSSSLGTTRALLGRWVGDLNGLTVNGFDDMMAVAMSKLQDTFTTAHIVSSQLF